LKLRGGVGLHVHREKRDEGEKDVIGNSEEPEKSRFYKRTPGEKRPAVRGKKRARDFLVREAGRRSHLQRRLAGGKKTPVVRGDITGWKP